MSETTNTPAVAEQQPFFGIQRVYLKGQSLEIPQGAQAFLETGTPAMNLNLQIENSELAPNVYECVLRATLTCELNGKVLFLLESDQAGIFEIRNVSAEQLRDLLEINAPSILGPYLRTQLADTLTRATLPMFFMPEIHWPSLAQQNREQMKAANDPAKLH